MKILFDTNIILDVLLLRKPFFTSTTFLLSEVEQGKIEGWLCPTSVITIGYLITKVKGPKEVKRLIKNLLNIFELTDLNKSIFQTACNHKINDYEDAVLHESARLSNIEGIVTRNVKDFKYASVNVYDPDELMRIIKSS